MLTKKDVEDILLVKFRREVRRFKLQLKWQVEAIKHNYTSRGYETQMGNARDKARRISQNLKLLRRFPIRAIGKKLIKEMLSEY